MNEDGPTLKQNFMEPKHEAFEDELPLDFRVILHFHVIFWGRTSPTKIACLIFSPKLFVELY